MRQKPINAQIRESGDLPCLHIPNPMDGHETPHRCDRTVTTAVRDLAIEKGQIVRSRWQRGGGTSDSDHGSDENADYAESPHPAWPPVDISAN